MNLSMIPVGKVPPWDINVIIEIAMGGNPIKYELDKDSGALFVDRFMHSAMTYPANYGFIPHTLADDGDPLDALVICDLPLLPGVVVRVRPVGVLFMEDEKGMDEKIITVPVSSLDPHYDAVISFEDLPKNLSHQIEHFFNHYKDLEKNKWVKIIRWGTAQEAADVISKTIRP